MPYCQEIQPLQNKLAMMIYIQKEKRERRRVRVKNVDGKDRLSDLPDSILIHILSLLDNCKTAVQSSVLSKRWKILWIYLPNLYFTNLTMGQKSYKLENFIDMVLKRRDPNVKLLSLSLRWVLRSTIPQTLLDRIHQYAQSHHVQHFNLCIKCLTGNAWKYYPSQNFNPTSLTTLRLNLSTWHGALYDKSSDDNCMLQQRYLAGLTALETLCLEDVDIFNCNRPLDLFSSLQNLKELNLVGCSIYGKDHSFNISAPRLERLTILDKVDRFGYVELRISSPTLKYLRLDLWTEDFSICNQPFLEELEISVHPYEGSRTTFLNENFVKNLIKALVSLSHAKSATISQSTLQVGLKHSSQVLSAFSSFLKSQCSCQQLMWKCLKVKKAKRFPVTVFPLIWCGLAYIRGMCSERLKVYIESE